MFEHNGDHRQHMCTTPTAAKQRNYCNQVTADLFGKCAETTRRRPCIEAHTVRSDGGSGTTVVYS